MTTTKQTSPRPPTNTPSARSAKKPKQIKKRKTELDVNQPKITGFITTQPVQDISPEQPQITPSTSHKIKLVSENVELKKFLTRKKSERKNRQVNIDGAKTCKLLLRAAAEQISGETAVATKPNINGKVMPDKRKS